MKETNKNRSAKSTDFKSSTSKQDRPPVFLENALLTIIGLFIVIILGFPLYERVSKVEESPSQANQLKRVQPPRSFMTVDCDDEHLILIEGELLFLRSSYGFIHDNRSGSILLEAVQKEVSGGVPFQKSLQLNVIQAISTYDLGLKYLEGGMLTAIFNESMHLTVDNAGENEVAITIAQHEAVHIPPKSQLSLGIYEGTKNISIREIGGANRTESFVLSAKKELDNGGQPLYKGYVINVFGANKYWVEKATYTTKQK